MATQNPTNCRELVSKLRAGGRRGDYATGFIDLDEHGDSELRPMPARRERDRNRACEAAGAVRLPNLGKPAGHRGVIERAAGVLAACDRRAKSVFGDGEKDRGAGRRRDQRFGHHCQL